MAMSRISAVFDADTAGLTAGTKQATAALRSLSSDIAGLDAVFRRLESISTQGITAIGPAANVAAQAMRSLESGTRTLEAQWQAGSLTIGQYRDGLLSLGRAAEESARLAQRGAALTAQFATPEKTLADRTYEYQRLKAAGAITEETFAAALRNAREEYERASGATRAAADAERERLAVQERARTVIESLMTSEERHIQYATELAGLASQGAITWEQYSAAVARSRQAMEAMSDATREQAALQQRGDAVTAQFASPETNLASKLSELQQLRSANVISEETYAAAMRAASEEYDRVTAAASRNTEAERERAAVMSRAAEVIRSIQTAEERNAASISELDDLLGAGAISYAQYSAAVNKANQELYESSDAYRQAQEAERQLNATMSAGAAVTRQVATAEETHADRLQELRRLLAAGAITQQTFNRAVNAAEREMRQASTATTAYRSNASALSGVMTRLNVVIGLQAAQLFIQLSSAVSQAVRGMINIGRESAQAVDKIDLLAKRTGQSRQALASLEFAGRQAGVGVEQLATATAKADRLFVQASNGSKQAAQAFQAIGLSVDELAGLSPEERFNRIADAIAQLPTEAQQSAAAIAIFGRAGAGLVPMFQDMQGGMAAVRQQAERLGFVLSDQQVASIDGMNDALDVAWMAVEGIVRQVEAGLSPAIQAVAELWTGFVEATGGANIGAGIVELLLDGAEIVARLFDFAASIFRPVWEYVSGVVERLGGVGILWQGVVIVMNSVSLAFQGVVNALAAVGSAVASAIYKVMEYAFSGAATVLDALGYDELAASAERASRAVGGLAAEAFANMESFGAAAGENFVGAVDNLWNPEAYGYTMGDAAAGTLEDGIENFRQRLRGQLAGAEAGVNNAGTNAANAINSVIENKLAAAVDSRSKEGAKEMLRLMYGQGNQIEEQQLAEQRRAADGIEELNENLDGFGIEEFSFP